MEISVSQIASDRLICKRQAPRAASASLERSAGIDALRMLAALGIIWFHMEQAPLRQIGYAGLPVFLLLFYSLLVRQGQTYTTAQFLTRRWRRLVAPWLFWSVLYGLGRLTRALFLADWASLSDMVSPGALVTGTYIHLWYLPYAFVSGFLLYEFNVRTWQRSHTAVALGATVVALATLAVYAHGVLTWSVTPPLAQWQFGLAALPLGFAIGRCLAIPSQDAQRVLLSVISLATVALYVVLSAQGRAESVTPYVLAAVLACLAYVCPARANTHTTALASLTFGIYLIHPVVAYGLRHVWTADRCSAVPIMLTACIAGLITWGLRKTPVRRFL
jgi:peptidoglycan/LPS O-acetylase OafA/YrhL